MKTIKAWAVLTNGRLNPYGDGANAYIYPVYPTRREAREWSEGMYNHDIHTICRVEIRNESGRKAGRP